MNTEQQDIVRQNEDKMVDDSFRVLLDTYMASKHRKKKEIITKAFNFARHAHKGVRRLSGEPYIMHPIAVAQIVCSEIGLGSTSICAALLHDVVEDTDYTVEDIENMFGPKIAQIVDGLTKISGGIFGEYASEQAENFKKLLLTMSDDIRVILIKIADRLHNMRTLGAQALNKRYKIAGETLYLYAPMAHRLGLNKIKTELEDLSFRYEHPDEYAQIESKLAATKAERDTVFDEFTAPIRQQLDEKGIKYEIKQRIKSPYSIWRKMQNKGKSFEEVYDILAVRIIFEPTDSAMELNECFDIYVSMCKIYTSHPDRLRDWVSRPKANGYQALHVTLMSNRGEWIEVQIRSNRMDEIAEKGLAAHWKYKDGEKTESSAELELDKWLTTIKEILDDPQPDAMDFLDTIKLNLYASEIFVFTPKGELRTLPAGSTVLDFAFTIHTFTGSHSIGAKVNHKLVPISHILQSGDQVEIITSKSVQPTAEWLDFVTTAKAKAKILSLLRKQERDAAKEGEEMLAHFFESHEIKNDSMSIDKLCRLHSLGKAEELFAAIGLGKIVLDDAEAKRLMAKDDNAGWRRLFSFGKSKDTKPVLEVHAVTTAIDRKKELVLNDDNLRHQYTLSDCCCPIPGDDVMGYIDDSNHIVIHKLQCSLASKLKSAQGNRILGARWATSHLALFPVTLQIEGVDTKGTLLQIVKVITEGHDSNIHDLNVKCDKGLFTAEITLYVHNTDDVKSLVLNLKKVNDVKSVGRV